MSYLEVHSPHDGSIVGKVDRAGGDEVEHALANAHALFVDRDAWLPLHERVAVLERAADALARAGMAPYKPDKKNGNEA